MPSTYTVGTLGSIEDVGVSIPTAIAAVPARTVKVITLKEYIAMKVGRKDREAQKNA
jgi:acyl CoA:acetate/3-ketoacid CoA transferase beta subunit